PEHGSEATLPELPLPSDLFAAGFLVLVAQELIHTAWHIGQRTHCGRHARGALFRREMSDPSRHGGLARLLFDRRRLGGRTPRLLPSVGVDLFFEVVWHVAGPGPRRSRPILTSGGGRCHG